MTVEMTVAICTWNRAERLRDTLEHLASAGDRGGDWELLVVDNGSTDHTPAVAADFATRLPLRVVVEGERGLSHARNAAIREARGRHIVWTDDDVHVRAGWLAAYADAFARWPDAAFFGGPVLPWFEGEPPRWLREGIDIVGTAYAVRDFGGETFEFDDMRLPFGANMAFRADAQRRHLYDPTLGRRGSEMLSGEETQVMRAILADGGTGRWVPGAAVDHFIPADRQTIGYLRRYFGGHGLAAALRGPAEGDRRFLGRPLWLWRSAVEEELRYRIARLTGPAPRWLTHLMRAAAAQGQFFARQQPLHD